ncbi:MAG: hypothetical protein BGO31_13835 [Bacteroidetes bacterium 43-16]|nr:MAG: hypothetical protein BGO31_13835 [Bacteroidetes bacterium 43-16]
MMKKIALVLLVIVLLGGAVAYYLFNKKPAQVEDIKSEAITASALVKAFEANEAEANKTYLNKVLDVSGVVQELSQNQDGQMVLVLAADDNPLSGVQCTMREAIAQVKVGDRLTIKGFCNGFVMTVILSDCIKTK